MQIDAGGFLHLTYCTNIHPGDGWDAVRANLERYAPALKQRLSPDGRFGIGLRLSAREARELLEGRRLRELRAFLDAHGLYVALLNGFPYGAFHGTVVKADVFAPDWRDEARVAYTLDLVEVLRGLLPDTDGVQANGARPDGGDAIDGGISTIPLSYKPWLSNGRRHELMQAWDSIARNVARVVRVLVEVRRTSGRFIHLDLEPEPDGLIENTDEVIDAFERWLLPLGAPVLAAALGIGEDAARAHLRGHVRVCFDCCHLAVEYEDPVAALARLDAAGIRVGRIQLSSALDVVLPAAPAERARLAARLAPFAESTYLHQVIECRGAGPPHCELHRFRDLPAALAEGPDAKARQWRIHFHVPLFTSQYEAFGSTQEDVRRVLAAAARTRQTRHLEIETYTWDVLPADLKLDLLESIDREYRWVLHELRPDRWS